MSKRTLNVDDALYDYLIEHSLRESEVLEALRRETNKMPNATMQIAPEQGQLMAFLVSLIGARRCLEVGVFTGYSALAVAAALPVDGEVIACDISDEWTQVGKKYWGEAGLAHKIDLRLAPAVETLQGLVDAGESGHFDFAFIDADKTNYQSYFDLSLTLVRTGGLIMVDNTLWGGKVADGSDGSEDTQAIRAFNRKLKGDQRVDISMLPMADGITLARKLG